MKLVESYHVVRLYLYAVKRRDAEDKRKGHVLPCAKLPHRNMTTIAATETETQSS